MKILFTGASSFTGMWFARELALAGHDVTTAFFRGKEQYAGLRRARVEEVLTYCRPIFDCPYGGEFFLKLISHERWDMLCHHASDVNDYKSPDFDIAKALASNTGEIKKIFSLMTGSGCRKILLTGSVFEQNEGQGSDISQAVSPYGLSKGLTADVFKYFSSLFEIKLGKFVIPNPFGPFEEPRYTTFLIRSWSEGITPKVACPDYVRDNIPVSLLAKAYLRFANQLNENSGFEKLSPSGYQESQGDFTRRFSKEMEKRLAIPCPFEIGEQKDFPEPKIRLNTDSLDKELLGWDEEKAWDELANYYKRIYGHKMQEECGCSSNYPQQQKTSATMPSATS